MPGVGAANAAYQVVSSIFADDLATDMNPERGNAQVSIGLILQAQASGEAVVAIRGTEGIRGWNSGRQVFISAVPFPGRSR